MYAGNGQRSNGIGQEESVPDQPSSHSPLDMLHRVKSGWRPMLGHLGLHGELAEVEWAIERQRWLLMLTTSLLGTVSLLLTLMLASTLVMSLVWNTPYRLPVLGGLTLLAGVLTAYAWWRFRDLSSQSNQAFAASREELLADLALWKERP